MAQRRTAAAVVLALALAGCSSSVAGHGANAPAGPTSHTPDFPAQTSQGGGPGPASGSTDSVPTNSVTTPNVPEPSTDGAPSTGSQPSGQPTTVTVDSGATYNATIWAEDDISDCAAHAYGGPMIAFLRKHPCRGAHRVLATINLHGKLVALSVISTGFAGTANDPYVNAGKFEQLEQANHTGSINDLLREGHSIPGIATQIPPQEAFEVLGQDSGVQIFDAWYATGTTRDQDPTLVHLEQSLFLSQLTEG